MSIIQDQINFTKVQRWILDDWEFRKNEKTISWHFGGQRYVICQFTTRITVTDEEADRKAGPVVRTRYLRDGKLHRLDGPSEWLIFNEETMDEQWWVDGKKYTKIEYDFFIEGIVTK